MTKAAAKSGMKLCASCGKKKPLEKFDKDVRAKDGHVSVCKTCRSYNRFLALGRKKCGKCGQILPLKSFYKVRRDDTGAKWSCYCKSCVQVYKNEWNCMNRNDVLHMTLAKRAALLPDDNTLRSMALNREFYKRDLARIREDRRFL